MKVNYMIVCEAAQEAGGKHYILGGGWDVLGARETPVTKERVSVAIQVAAPKAEASKSRRLVVDVEDGKGNSILDNKFDVIVSIPASDAIADGEVARNMVFNFLHLQFPSTGAFRFVAKIDGELAASQVVRVLKSG